MKLKDRLKELRTARNMTQKSVGERLGVSSQTVSKWERGLLSPDIALLPKIALLFKCSIDYLFDIDLIWSDEHRREFETEIHELHTKKDWEGEAQELENERAKHLLLSELETDETDDEKTTSDDKEKPSEKR